jgi:hypothetical protein
MERLGPKTRARALGGGRVRGIGPEHAAGGTREGAVEVIEGMVVGGKSCCAIAVRYDMALLQVAAELQI